MPVRSLSSSVLKWPDARTVHKAVCQWAEQIREQQSEVLRIGYFGSYARGDWGVGSDLDMIIVVQHTDEQFERRAAQWDVTRLPIPTDVLVYRVEEWESLNREGRFYRTIENEVVWVYDKERDVG